MVSVEWVFFDLNGTLLDPSGMAAELGGGEEARRLVQGAFEEALLLAMADTLSGAYRPLSEHLRAALERWLFVSGHEMQALESMMRRADAMDPFPHAEQALKRLADAGLHVAVLTNSSAQSARSSLRQAGLLDAVAAVIGSEAVRVYKPHPMVYRRGVEQVGAAPERCCMVAAHGWDLMGAARVGLRTAWVAHLEQRLPATIPEPDLRADDLAGAARAIVDQLTGTR
ncbi:MAG: haloacid dehalogenase type II [Actinomycetota bacterium]|nr:haloacid dehalogenase type II [Actinomycetota bacterium]